MVYYTDTLIPCHRLTRSGEIEYRKMLEEKADEILFKHEHPVRYYLGVVREFFRNVFRKSR